MEAFHPRNLCRKSKAARLAVAQTLWEISYGFSCISRIEVDLDSQSIIYYEKSGKSTTLKFEI